MNKQVEKMFQVFNPSHQEVKEENRNEIKDMTNLQDDSVNTSVIDSKSDNVSVVPDEAATDEKNNAGINGEMLDEEPKEPSWEEKYQTMNDSYLRLNAEFDNYRKRTIREKADLIKSGGATAMANLLPVIDDFERAINMLQTTDDLTSAVEGVKLIYDKFISYLSQQGVKVIETIDQPFDTDYFEAIATFPVPEKDRKGLVIDCVQTGYKIYDKVLRHAKVVVGE
jgi:molecular chaperone GrpE